MQELEKKVLQLISERLTLPMESLKKNQSFIEDLGIDSLDLAELIMDFEDEFNVNIPQEEWNSIQTIGQAIEFIQKNSPLQTVSQ